MRCVEQAEPEVWAAIHGLQIEQERGEEFPRLVWAIARRAVFLPVPVGKGGSKLSVDIRD
jgi:hypothetical protein